MLDNERNVGRATFGRFSPLDTQRFARIIARKQALGARERRRAALALNRPFVKRRDEIRRELRSESRSRHARSTPNRFHMNRVARSVSFECLAQRNRDDHEPLRKRRNSIVVMVLIPFIRRLAGSRVNVATSARSPPRRLR